MSSAMNHMKRSHRSQRAHYQANNRRMMKTVMNRYRNAKQAERKGFFARILDKMLSKRGER